MKLFEALCGEIDWDLLRSQKEALVALRFGDIPPSNEALDGIINLLDALQDTADSTGFPVYKDKREHEPHDLLCAQCCEQIDQCLGDNCMEDDHHTDSHSVCSACESEKSAEQ